MSRHTTSFTTDPMYRARNELRNRLERIRGEAQTTAGCIGEFPGNEVEQAMWVALDNLCEGMIDGLTAVNEMERANRSAAPRPTGHQVGHELAGVDYREQEPA